MKRGFLSIALLVISCDERTLNSQMAPKSTSNFALMDQSSGTASLYLGPDVATILGRGETLAEGSPHSFYMLQVPSDLVTKAEAKELKVFSFSLEEKQPFSAKLVVNQRRLDKVDVTSVAPGDAWVTGIGQVWIGPSGSPIGLFEMRIWQRHEAGNYTVKQFSTGLRADPEIPALKYQGNPTTWPAMPAHWR
jgi:hypothetical protein